MVLLEALSGSGSKRTASMHPSAPVTADEARRWGRWAYAALALGLVLYVVTLWAQILIDTRKLAAPTTDWVAESHRHWRLRTALLFLLWSIIGLLTVPVTIGWFVLIPTWIWTAYRVLRGAICFARHRPIGAFYIRHAHAAAAAEPAQPVH